MCSSEVGGNYSFCSSVVHCPQFLLVCSIASYVTAGAIHSKIGTLRAIFCQKLLLIPQMVLRRRRSQEELSNSKLL